MQREQLSRPASFPNGCLDCVCRNGRSWLCTRWLLTRRPDARAAGRSSPRQLWRDDFPSRPVNQRQIYYSTHLQVEELFANLYLALDCFRGLLPEMVGSQERHMIAQRISRQFVLARQSFTALLRTGGRDERIVPG